ncbi:MAG: energy coupling factor transporter S component ThiW [Nitrososphaerota archaeon]
MSKTIYIKKLTLSSILSVLALIISPFSWFAWGPTKAFPGQHLVNVIAGIILGPAYAIFIATIVGTIRIMLGIGTLFAYPGGIPGGLIVGLSYKFLRKIITKRKAIIIASLTEPIGTVLIGGTISWYIFDPLLGSILYSKFLSLLPFYFGWILSSISGCLLGMIITLTLDKIGIIKLIFKET